MLMTSQPPHSYPRLIQMANRDSPGAIPSVRPPARAISNHLLICYDHERPTERDGRRRCYTFRQL